LSTKETDWKKRTVGGRKRVRKECQKPTTFCRWGGGGKKIPNKLKKTKKKTTVGTIGYHFSRRSVEKKTERGEKEKVKNATNTHSTSSSGVILGEEMDKRFLVRSLFLKGGIQRGCVSLAAKQRRSRNCVWGKVRL